MAVSPTVMVRRHRLRPLVPPSIAICCCFGCLLKDAFKHRSPVAGQRTDPPLLPELDEADRKPRTAAVMANEVGQTATAAAEFAHQRGGIEEAEGSSGARRGRNGGETEGSQHQTLCCLLESIRGHRHRP